MVFLSKLFPNYSTVFLFIVYIVSIFWYLTLDTTSEPISVSNYWYTVLEGLIPLWGGLYGLYLAKKWGGFSSIIGKAQSYISLGLISWGIGELIFAGYYNLLMNVEVPYPSLADAAFILSWPLWGIGMVYLSRATGFKTALHNKATKYWIIILPIIIIVFSYYLLVHVARAGVISSSADFIKVFFDLAYPIGDVVILTFATIIYGLSFKYFAGKFRLAIYFILFGFVVNYFADFSFSYQTTLETFVPGGFTDFLFVTAMFAISFGVNSLDSRSV